MSDENLRNKLMDTAKVAGYLRVSENTIRAWVKRRCMPFTKINGAIRFDVDQIDAWIERNSQDDINECGALSNGGFQKIRQQRPSGLRH